MVKECYLNPIAVVFHPELDRKNNYTTIVFNPSSEEVLKVSPFGYKILQQIDNNPGISIEKILGAIPKDAPKVIKFLETMRKENVIFEK